MQEGRENLPFVGEGEWRGKGVREEGWGKLYKMLRYFPLSLFLIFFFSLLISILNPFFCYFPFLLPSPFPHIITKIYMYIFFLVVGDGGRGLGITPTLPF